MLLKILQCNRTDLPSQHRINPAPNVTSAKGEKPCSEGSLTVNVWLNIISLNHLKLCKINKAIQNGGMVLGLLKNSKR